MQHHSSFLSLKKHTNLDRIHGNERGNHALNISVWKPHSSLLGMENSLFSFTVQHRAEITSLEIPFYISYCPKCHFCTPNCTCFYLVLDTLYCLCVLLSECTKLSTDTYIFTSTRRSAVFNMFTKLYNHHHNQLQGILSPPQKRSPIPFFLTPAF